MGKVRIGILGCGGRMGRMLLAEVAATEGCVVAGGVDAPGSAAVGRDLGELALIEPLGLEAGSDRATLFADSDVVIDFTVPSATVAHAALASDRGKALVIGTTGLDPAQSAAVAQAAKRAPIFWAPNMSVAVTLLTDLVEKVAQRLGPDYDIEILEMHHRHKVDAPSGTALALGRAAAAGARLSSTRWRSACGTAIPERGTRAISALRRCVAATSRASIPSSSQPTASASNWATRRRAGASLPPVQ